LAMYFVELFDFQQVLASVIATAGYTSIVVFRNLSSRTKNA